MKRGGHGLGETTPERAPPPPQVQRTGRAGRQRHKPPSYDSSPAAASASRRPSFSPRGSTADPCSAAEAAVRETEICAPPSAQFRSSRCAHAASAKPLRLFIALWVQCISMLNPYPPLAPSGRCTGSSGVTLYRYCRSICSRLPACSFAARLALQWRRSRAQEVVQ